MLEANALGVMQMGCLSGMAAGFTKAKKTGKSYNEMKKGMKALFVAGNCAGCRFQDRYAHRAASHANDSDGKGRSRTSPGGALREAGIDRQYLRQRRKSLPRPSLRRGVKGWCRDSCSGLDCDQQDQGLQGKGHRVAREEGEGRKDRSRILQAGQAAPQPSPMAVIATVLLMAMNQGMLAGSAVSKVMSREGRRAAKISKVSICRKNCLFALSASVN